MNVNFGLFPPIEVQRTPGVRISTAEKGLARKRALSRRALADLDGWLAGAALEAAE
jgi:methylenetetrahydrofolate--tRNA-(uracil-5-)-methyltransferase